MNEVPEFLTKSPKILTDDDHQRLNQQNNRLVVPFKAADLEKNARKYWDLFYKRNENRFFKDRHWTTREFNELLDNNNNSDDNNCGNKERRILLEIGCGVGNFIFPLIEERLNFQIIACDLSPRAVDIVQKHPLYDPNVIKAFQCDITTEEVFDQLQQNSVDIVTLIFVLSAIHPDKFVGTLKTIYKLLKPGGCLLFRDYGLYDMAQIRFKAGHKIGENFYMRQDGTRSYYFSIEYLQRILEEAGYKVVKNSYIHRRTVNKKENIDVPRIFIQAKALKCLE